MKKLFVKIKELKNIKGDYKTKTNQMKLYIYFLPLGYFSKHYFEEKNGYFFRTKVLEDLVGN